MADVLRILEDVWARLRLNERRCAACHGPFVPRAGEGFCPDCRTGFAGFGAHCPLCGRELAGTAVLCGECLRDPPPWSALGLIGPYTGSLRDVILRAKFGGDEALLAALGAVLAESWPKDAPVDGLCLVPVPLFPARLRERGFNQCQELARGMGWRLGLPVVPELLRRMRDTPTQRGLDARARQGNVRGAFQASARVAGQRVVLVDDVLTTGATLRAAAQTLQDAGAAWIGAAVLARD